MMSRLAINGFLLIVAVLAGSTAYFATKASVLQDHLTRRSTSPTSLASATASPTPTSSTSLSPSASSPNPVTSSSLAATPAPSVAASNRLSLPSETYTVLAGDTLYPVSLKQNMTLERLAEANGLVDPYKLSIGQVLAIPEVNAKQNIFEVRFTTDPTRATQIQTTVTNGSNAWRLDPVQVAKAESAGVFGLSASDDYRESSRDIAQGTAVITVSRLVGNLTKTYEVTLTQPATKGATGIWAITKVSPKAA